MRDSNSDFKALHMGYVADDVVSVPTGEMIKILTQSFKAFVRQGNIASHPAVFLRGQPGVGKSQGIRRLAARLRGETGKDVRITDIRLLMFNPIDLRGIPVADISTRTAIWLKPAILDLDPSPEIINIFFLDELTAAPQSLQAAAYQIALDRRIGEHMLPLNTFVIAAGNRLEDHAVTYVMPSALKNRMIQFDVIVNAEDWLSWASETGIHPDLIRVVERNPDLLTTTDFNREKSIIVTPRSWEIASDLLKALGGTVADHQTMMAAVFGKSLLNFILTSGTDSTPLVDIIIAGGDVEIPQTLSESMRILQKLELRIDQFLFSQEQTVNVLRYLLRIPPDQGLGLFRLIIRHDIQSYSVRSLPEYQAFIERMRQNGKD